MKYYIDFDNTLLNTSLLTNEMLSFIAETIAIKNPDVTLEAAFEECKDLFNAEHIYNIYTLVTHMSEKYNLDSKKLETDINNIILNSEKFLYEDSIDFLKKIKKAGHNLYILSYCNNSLTYQSAKILGAGIVDYFDALYITSVPKYELDIKYENGIFIDDNPTDLEGLISKNPLKVIRVRRKGNKYSKANIDNPNIVEYKTLTDILI